MAQYTPDEVAHKVREAWRAMAPERAAPYEAAAAKERDAWEAARRAYAGLQQTYQQLHVGAQQSGARARVRASPPGFGVRPVCLGGRAGWQQLRCHADAYGICPRAQAQRYASTHESVTVKRQAGRDGSGTGLMDGGQSHMRSARERRGRPGCGRPHRRGGRDPAAAATAEARTAAAAAAQRGGQRWRQPRAQRRHERGGARLLWRLPRGCAAHAASARLRCGKREDRGMLLAIIALAACACWPFSQPEGSSKRWRLRPA